MPDAPVPPRRTRLGFWLLGRRVPVEHRPWAAQQILAADFQRRRLRAVLALQVAVVAVPQAVLAATSGGLFNLGLAVLVAGGFVLALRFSPAMTPAQQARLLAHQGVTADGELVPPVPLWHGSGVSPAASAVLVVNVVVLGAGIVVVGDRFVSPDRCRSAPPAAVAALEAQLPGARLEAPQRVSTVFDGVYYVAGQVPTGSGPTRTAVWRVIEPGSTFDLTERDVTAVDPAAQELTPRLGTTVVDDDEPLLDKARSCVREAAD